MRLFICYVFLCVSCFSYAQKKCTYVNIDGYTLAIFGKDTIAGYESEGNVDHYFSSWASFPGGIDSLTRFFYKNIRYPSEWLKKGVEDSVWVKCAISKEGKIINPKIFVHRDALFSTKEEINNFIKTIPNFYPATYNGVPEVTNYFEFYLYYGLKNGKPISYEEYQRRLYKKHALAWYNSGVSNYKEGFFNSAINDYSMALFLNENDTSSYYNRAMCYFRLGDFVKGCEDLDSASAKGFSRSFLLKDKFCIEEKLSKSKSFTNYTKEQQKVVSYVRNLCGHYYDMHRYSDSRRNDLKVIGNVVLLINVNQLGKIVSDSIKVLNHISDTVDNDAIRFVRKYLKNEYHELSKDTFNIQVVLPFYYGAMNGINISYLKKEALNNSQFENYNEAIKQYNMIIRLCPFDYVSWYNRISCKNKLGLNLEVCSDIEKMKLLYLYEVNLAIKPDELFEIYCK